MIPAQAKKMKPLQSNKSLKIWLLGIVATCAVSGCEVGPDYHTPELKMPDKFMTSADSKDKTAAVNTAQWWKSLNDDTLNGLIDKALKGNPQLEIALMHVQEAREQEAVVLGTALPEVEASAGGGSGTGSDLARGRASQALVSGENTDGLSHVNQIYGFDAGWELDLFGQYRREAEAAHYDRQAAEAARENVILTIIADVVRSYVDMRGLQMQLVVLDKNIDAARQYMDFVQQRYNRGITNGLDLTLAQREEATLQAQQAPLAAKIQASAYTIAVLCGEFPETMIKELDTPGQIPQVPEKLATGLPLDLLRNRPDIHQTERKLAGASARIGIATANLFPHFAVTGAIGNQSQGFGFDPTKQGFLWSLGPSISWPVLDFGTLDAQVNIVDYHTRAMLMQYKQTVLNAVQDVDTASASYMAQQDRLKNLHKALDASEQAVSLASQRFDRGLTDSLNVIDAQRQQFELEQQYVVAQQTAAEQFVALYKALGSGWEQYQKLPKIRQPLPAVIAALQRTVQPDRVVK